MSRPARTVEIQVRPGLAPVLVDEIGGARRPGRVGHRVRTRVALRGHHPVVWELRRTP